MSGRLNLYQSLDPTELAKELAKVLGESRGYPFRKDIIIIDGKGPSNWISHAIVRDGGLGIQMNADLLSTWRIIPWLCSILRGDSRKERPADPLQGLTAKLYALLESEPGEWKDYVGEFEIDGGTVCWDLCVRLTQHYRELLRNDADWIARAEQGAPDRWSKLWSNAINGLRADFAERRGGAHHSPIHEADILLALNDAENRQKIADQLPGRICWFSLGDVPRSHLQILKALSDTLDIHLFFVQPSQGFLDDLKNYDDDDLSASNEEIKHSTAYRLLCSSGKYYSLQQSKVIDFINPDQEVFIPSKRRAPADSSLLGYIQNGIDQFDSNVAQLNSPDDSISIHRCHGAWREAEVVRDQILAAFADPSLAGLRQGDILILSPEPEVHAPLIAGVLSARTPSFEFTTAGMQGLRKSPVGNLVKSLLELPTGRVTSLDILGVMGLEVVRDHTGWTDSDLEIVEEWFKDAPFQWGINKAHREYILLTGLNSISEDDSEFEATEVGTLNEFLKRLSLGTAFGGTPRLIEDSLPLVGVDGQQSLGLAAESLRVLRAIKNWAEFATDEHTFSEWIAAFTEINQALRPHSRQFLEEFAELSGALSRMKQRVAQFSDSPLTLRLFSQLAEEYCDFEAGVGQFMTGKVTLAPLRASSIHPAKVIILMGMNDGSFPKRAPKTGPEVVVSADGKDTLTRLRLSAREETSMHAFLLAVLSAQNRLIITFDGYVGSEGKPGSAALPVEILRAAVQESVNASNAFNIRTHGLLSHHRPLPHGGKPDPVVRDKSALLVAHAVNNPKSLSVLVPPLPKSAKDFTFAEWLRFWESPPRHALRQLGVHIPWDKKVIATAEPLQPDSEARQQAEKWVARHVESVGKPKWEIAEKTGFFPSSQEGELLFDILVETAEEGENLMLEELCKNLAPKPDSEPLKLKELNACELLPFKTDQFRLFAHGDTVGVACLGYFSIYKHPYRWIMCLPAIAQHLGRPINRLFVVGIVPHSASDINEAIEGKKSLDIKATVNYLDLPVSELDSFCQKVLKLMDRVIDETTPLMPITFYKGLDQVFKDPDKRKPIKISDDDLRKPEQGRGDADDPRARILIPEEYNFEVMINNINELFSSEIRRLTNRDIPKYARISLEEQKEQIEANEEEKDRKNHAKIERANKKSDSSKLNKKSPKKKEDPS